VSATVWLLAATLVAVPDVSLDGLDAVVARQLAEVRRRLESADATAGGARGAAGFGEAGRHYHAYDMFAPAEACYRNAAALAPEDFRWPYLLGVLQQDAGRLEEAAASLGRALRGPEPYYPGLLRMAALQLALGRADEAERWLAPARAHAPDDPARLALDGEQALAAGRPEAAAAALEEALQREPRASRLHYLAGMAYRAQGRREDARRELARAGPVGVRARDPLVDGVRALRAGESSFMIEGHQALRAGDFPAAAAAFARALEASGGGSVPALLNLAAAEAQLGRTDDAISRLTKARRLDPAHPAVAYNLGVLLLQAGRAAEAEALLGELARRAPDDTEAHAEWSLALIAQGRLDDAAAALGSLTLDPARCRRLREALATRGGAGETAPAALVRRANACAAKPAQR
jgi:tetratricopeptide (TPR) repeat protein